MSITQLSYPIQMPSKNRIALAIGYFDGVHLGHQEVIYAVKRLAKQLTVPSAIMSFDPHPSEIVKKIPMTQYLTPLQEKITQFKRFGFHEIYIVKFDPVLAQLSKEDFIEQVLIPLGVKGVVTGFNFTFGKNALGRADDLKHLAKKRYATHIVKPVCIDGQVISSTRGRLLLQEGRLKELNRLLGRNYVIEGKVVRGDKRGRQIGFPTANLSLSQPFLTPRYGVYVVRVKLHKTWVHGVMNVGVRPTFNRSISNEKIEVHLLDYNDDLYEKTLRVEVLNYIREERRFPSLQALSTQISCDIGYARNWLSTTCPFDNCYLGAPRK